MSRRCHLSASCPQKQSLNPTFNSGIHQKMSVTWLVPSLSVPGFQCKKECSQKGTCDKGGSTRQKQVTHNPRGNCQRKSTMSVRSQEESSTSQKQNCQAAMLVSSGSEKRSWRWHGGRGIIVSHPQMTSQAGKTMREQVHWRPTEGKSVLLQQDKEQNSALFSAGTSLMV